jgi:hypothetical protein
VLATKEKRRRTRSPPQDGHATAVSTEAVIERRSSNRCSHARQRYSYVAIDRRIAGRSDTVPTVALEPID